VIVIDPARPKITSPQVYLLGMALFLSLAFLVAIILGASLVPAFLANQILNGVILFVLLIGVILSFIQVLRLYPEVRWVNGFEIGDRAADIGRPPLLLAPMATMMSDQTARMSLSTTSMRSLLDSIGSRLDEARDYSRYIIGLLIFLGLLGTFWGLLQTITSVGDTIRSLNVGTGEAGVMFEELKSGLEGPLAGMGTAFSSSLFGLAGSLILGFLDLVAGQAQNRFYNDLEEWLSTVTELSSGDAGSGLTPAHLRFTLQDMQVSVDALATSIHEGKMLGKGNGEGLSELADGVQQLVRQMRQEQKLVREWAQIQADQQAELTPVLRDLIRQMRAGRADVSEDK
jgi:hypothetical protein